MMNKIDSGGSMSESTLVTVLADESSITSSSSVHINNNNNKTVRWQPDPKHPDKVLRIRHRYRRPKNPYDLYVNSEEQYQNCLETRGHAKKLRRQLLAEGQKSRGWMALLSSNSEEEASVERILPLQYALDEQVRGLEKEIISEFKQQSSQHRKRHAQTILLSQALDDVDDDNDAQQQLMSDLSRKSSAKSNALARLLALVDEHYVQELLKAEPIVLPIIIATPAPANEQSTAAEKNSNDSPEHNHPQESGGERRRKPPRATRSFGPFKQRKERTLPRATRSFSKAVRRIGNNFRRHPDSSSSSDIRAPPPHHPPAMPLVPV
ncbi:expressed unknown protein [Seminavis robusta]|uniref:Uncharacterized protein n=1 Tax=Seminavis robusta TaxID=568900 RepID=A0A9N8HZW6_9STRA|nr:expressed unknown protein [Seminavis robusta]|eukprot:Sro2405_g326510.1 n/a (322) ;mRNA; f:9293-10258